MRNKKKLLSTDFNVANLEAPIINNNILDLNKKQGLFQKSINTKWYDEFNIKAFSLANNHILDFGVKGLKNTINVLDINKIYHFGAGMNIEDALTPAIITINDIKIAFHGFLLKFFKTYHFADINNPGVAEFRNDYINKSLNKSHADINIIYNHWNQEFEDYPEPLCKDIAEKFSHKANVIVGAHPHCIQGFHKIQNNYIFYSLGNFSMPNIKFHNCFLSKYPEKCYHSFFIIIEIHNNKISHVDLFPFVLNENATHIIEPSNRQRQMIFSHLNEISKPLYMDTLGYKKFYNKNKARKLRPSVTTNDNYNYLRMAFYRILIKFIQIFENIIAKTLDVLGVRNLVKRKFNRLINKLHKIK